jgi:sterol desaturase/sphingolipid hydroxylase (fatty acid hydroxylase superfamily)
VPIVIALATVEGLVAAILLKRRYDWRAYFASMADFLVREFIVYRLLPFSLAMPVIGWAWQHRLATIPLNGWVAFALLFVGQEFCYYWFHRCSHRIRWFWATHAVHHSPNELSLSAAYRFGWTGRASGTALFYTPLIWLGFPPQAVFATLSLNLLYQFWLHTTWTPKLGWLEYVLNTPSHHRVHHASNPEYLDANYGGVLIVFDRLFGTLAVERDDTPCRYGLVKPLTSNNPVVIAFHEWLALARDVWQARTWGERLKFVFGPPGWRPDGTGLTTENLRRGLAVKAT